MKKALGFSVLLLAVCVAIGCAAQASGDAVRVMNLATPCEDTTVRFVRLDGKPFLTFICTVDAEGKSTWQTIQARPQQAAKAPTPPADPAK